MSGTVWKRFFWGDWANDPALRVCSLAAQGLWMRMLCVAAEARPVGFVAVGGRALTDEDFARLGGVAAQEAGALVAELERNGVFSRNRKGTIYCRRMVRDEKKARASAKGGRKGGPLTLAAGKGIFAARGGARAGTRGRTRAPDSHSQAPGGALPARAAAPARAASGGGGVRSPTHARSQDGIDWPFRLRWYAGRGWDQGWGRPQDIPAAWREAFRAARPAAGEDIGAALTGADDGR
jgi:hypothetical protein